MTHAGQQLCSFFGLSDEGKVHKGIVVGVFSMHLYGVSMNLQVSASQWPPHGSVLVPLAPSPSFSLHTYKGALLASSHSAAKPCVYPIILRPSGSRKTLRVWEKKKKRRKHAARSLTCVHLYMFVHVYMPTNFPLLSTHNANKAFSSLSCALSFPIFVSMAARAVAYSEPSCCSDGLQSSKSGKVGEEQEDRRSPAGVDYVRRSVLVEVGTLSLIVCMLYCEQVF